MVNALNENISSLPVVKYGKSTKHSTRQCHQADEGKRGLEAERVRALEALRSLQSKKKLSAEKRWETHFLSNEEKVKWIEDYVERETTVARQWVQDAEGAIMQELKDMTTAETAGVTTRKPETMFEQMINAIGDSLSDLASSDDEQDGEDEEDHEEHTELGKLSDDDEPGWVMHTISKQYSTAWRVFARSRWSVTNWRNGDGGTQPTTSVSAIWSMGLPNRLFHQLSSHK